MRAPTHAGAQLEPQQQPLAAGPSLTYISRPLARGLELLRDTHSSFWGVDEDLSLVFIAADADGRAALSQGTSVGTEGATARRWVCSLKPNLCTLYPFLLCMIALLLSGCDRNHNLYSLASPDFSATWLIAHLKVSWFRFLGSPKRNADGKCSP